MPRHKHLKEGHPLHEIGEHIIEAGGDFTAKFKAMRHKLRGKKD